MKAGIKSGIYATLAIVCGIIVTDVKAQFASLSDPALAYNKLVLEKSDGSTYDLVSNYKVIGTPFLFGENAGGVYAADGTSATKTTLRYNTYTQSLEVVADDQKHFYTKKMAEIDSFFIKPGAESLFKTDLFFVRGTLLDGSKNNFMQVVSTGKNANLYKAYYSDLGVVSTNYIQSELRQYDLKFEYYYSSPETKGLKKIKLNRNWIVGEFGKYKVESIANKGFSQNSEAALKEIFTKINQ